MSWIWPLFTTLWRHVCMIPEILDNNFITIMPSLVMLVAGTMYHILDMYNSPCALFSLYWRSIVLFFHAIGYNIKTMKCLKTFMLALDTFRKQYDKVLSVYLELLRFSVFSSFYLFYSVWILTFQFVSTTVFMVTTSRILMV